MTKRVRAEKKAKFRSGQIVVVRENSSPQRITGRPVYDHETEEYLYWLDDWRFSVGESRLREQNSREASR